MITLLVVHDRLFSFDFDQRNRRPPWDHPIGFERRRQVSYGDEGHVSRAVKLNVKLSDQFVCILRVEPLQYCIQLSFLSFVLRFLPVATLKSRPSGRGLLFLRFIHLASMQRLAGSRPMERMSGMSIAKPVSMREDFSRLPNRQICQSFNQPNSNW
jgi:hypothetical protein